MMSTSRPPSVVSTRPIETLTVPLSPPESILLVRYLVGARVTSVPLAVRMDHYARVETTSAPYAVRMGYHLKVPPLHAVPGPVALLRSAPLAVRAQADDPLEQRARR